MFRGRGDAPRGTVRGRVAAPPRGATRIVRRARAPLRYFGSKYISGKSEEARLRSRTAEINNGRLAMIGIMSFIAASTVPGSVPYFTEDLMQYSGSVWAPF